MEYTLKNCINSKGKTFSGLYEIEPHIFSDSRGLFLEAYNEKDFFSDKLTYKFIQDNFSRSKQNVIRGLHYQKRHSQAKLIHLTHGKIYDLAIDLRNESETFGSYYGTILDAEKYNMLYIPKGFAHGFVVLSDYADTLYKCSDFYQPDEEAGIIWNDNNLSINWKDFINEDNILLSDKDKKYPSFDCSKKYFDMTGEWIGE